MITYNIKIRDNLPVYSDMLFTTGDVRAYKFNFDFVGINTENCTVTLKAKRADDVIVTESGSVSGGIVLPNSMYSVAGEVQFEVALYNDSGCATTKVIYANVRGGFGEEGIAGDDRYPVLTTLINQVNSISRVTVENNLKSSSHSAALSANMGRVLDENKVNKENGKGLSTNDFTDADKEKLDSLSVNPKITVDSTLSILSENPVQNKTITKYVNGISENVGDLTKLPTAEKKSVVGAIGELATQFYTTVKEYGVRWKGTSSTKCERLGDAVGLVANAHLGVYDNSIRNDFDNIYPWSEIKTCNVDVNGNILAFEGEPSFKRDGTNGDVMVRIPKFYYKRIKTSDGHEEWWICEARLPGYALHPLFMDDDKEISEAFIAAYNMSIDDFAARSISGVQPAVNHTRAEFRTYARNKGSIFGIEDLTSIHARQMLYLIEFANTNSQRMLGNGVCALSESSTAPANGGCDSLKGASGYIGSNGYADVSYRGIEGFHGKILGFIDGVNIIDRTVYYSNNMSLYSDTTAGYKSAGYSSSLWRGYITSFGYDKNAPWVMIPTDTGGAEGTYVPDWYDCNNEEGRVPCFGGVGNQGGSLNGAFAVFIYKPAYSSSMAGARLLIKKP